MSAHKSEPIRARCRSYVGGVNRNMHRWAHDVALTAHLFDGGREKRGLLALTSLHRWLSCPTKLSCRVGQSVSTIIATRTDDPVLLALPIRVRNYTVGEGFS